MLPMRLPPPLTTASIANPPDASSPATATYFAVLLDSYVSFTEKVVFLIGSMGRLSYSTI